MSRAANPSQRFGRRLTPASVASRLVLAAVLAALPGCKKKTVDILDETRQTGIDHGHAAVLAAVARAATEPASPTAYRELARSVEQTRGVFNADIAALAELHQVYLALGPLEAARAAPRPEQLQALALTVYPTALGVEPRAGEDAAAFVERLCRDELPLVCGQFVPEGWPLVLSARAWAELRDRARDAYHDCSACRLEPSYQAALDRFDQIASAEAAELALREDDLLPAAWPMAGPGAAPWSGAPLLELVGDAGEARFAGQVLPPGSWRTTLAAGRGAGEVLGVHLYPRAPVGTLRAVAREAAAAGYRELAIQARERAYPYPTREYRVALAAGRPLDVRDVDTVQFLVRAADLARANGLARVTLPRAR